MIRLRRHSAFVLLIVLLIGGLPVLHTAQHAAEYAQTSAVPAHHAPADAHEAPGVSASEADGATLAVRLAGSERASCDLCAHTLYGTPLVMQPAAVLQEAISEKTRLRSRVVAATPYHFVIRGPPAHA